MADIDSLQRAAYSLTWRRWITNPVRRAVFAAGKPYFYYIIGALAELQRRSASDELLKLGRMIDGLRKDQMAVNYRLGSIEDQEQEKLSEGSQAALLQFGSSVESLRQELLATRHRADDIEAEQKKASETAQAALLQFGALVESLRQSTEALHHRVDGIEDSAVGHQKVSGISTLPHNIPVALRGTSLVLHDGPYGCFILRQPDLISDHILAGGFWDAHLKSVIERAGANCTAIDAGAYLGFHTVYMSRYFRTVHAFEPQTEIYQMLCANLLLNNCRNVIAVRAALYDEPGFMRVAGRTQQEIPVPSQANNIDYDRIGNAAALAFRPADAGSKAATPAQTVDQLDLTDLGFMKVDTQGSDLHVLRGARTTIQRCRPIVAVEFERELAKIHNNTLDDYYSFFDDLNYTVSVLDERGDGKQVDLLANPR
jgi:FkbM family methyltransferase